MRALRTTSIKRARIQRAQPSLRRFDSSSSHSHAEPVEEHFGKWFFITLTAIPVSFAIIKYANTSTIDSATGRAKPALLTRIIDSYSGYKERWAERNNRHTRMIEQASHDKHLFYGAEGSRTVELRFPEIFNTGSPWNVMAGQGGVNLDKVIEKYTREHRELEEKKMRKLEEKRALEKEGRETRR